MAGVGRNIVTGGLGVGKTTVLAALSHSALVVGEPARELIAEHRAASGEESLDGRPEEFVERLIDRSIAKYESVPEGATALFDRGVPDCIAYAAVLGLDTGPALEAARRFRYESEVIVVPPWEEIYTTDDMRRATFEQAEAFYAEVVAAYGLLGYDMVELPKVSVEERVSFIEEWLRR